jgi:hypothetical protein
LTCADGNWGIEHIKWATWGSTAYGTFNLVPLPVSRET